MEFYYISQGKIKELQLCIFVTHSVILGFYIISEAYKFMWAFSTVQLTKLHSIKENKALKPHTK
jgi:hypothetical protein